MSEFWLRASLIATLTLTGGSALAQTPPTATEVFNLRIKCKQMADEKADSLEMKPMTAAVDAMNKNIAASHEVIISSHSSKYDAKNNMRQIYDAQTDDLLAFATIKNGEKIGMVFDHDHRTTTDINLGWDDANAYIDEMMVDKRKYICRVSQWKLATAKSIY